MHQINNNHRNHHTPIQSEQISELAKALCKVQAEVSGAKKGSSNPFFKSNYADLHAVIKSAFPYLSKYGLSVSQGNEIIPGAVCVTTTLLHESGQWLRSKVKVPMPKVDAQGVGTAGVFTVPTGLTSTPFTLCLLPTYLPFALFILLMALRKLMTSDGK